MECSLASTYSSTEQTKTSVSAGSLSTVKSEKTTKSGLHVNFTEKGEVKERREKFLTAKYGSHQMNLIRKRLAVEMWLYEEIQKLCSLANVTKEIEVDIDELLDLDDEDQRRQQIKNQMPDVVDCCPDQFKVFSEELLQKMNTL